MTAFRGRDQPSVLDGVELLTARYTRHRFGRHFHEGYALGRIERGAMRFRYLGATHTAPAGEVNLAAPGEVHDGHAALEEGWAYRMFYLPVTAMQQAAQELGMCSKLHYLPHFRQGVIRDPELARRVGLCHARLLDPTAPRLEKEHRLLALLAFWVARHADGRQGAPRRRATCPAAVRRMRELIDADYGRDLCLAELAATAGLSVFHAARLFSTHVGAPPHAYLVQRRVAAAKDLLASGRATGLADLAQACGFADQPHLTRAFKALVGVTPGSYRKHLQDL